MRLMVLAMLGLAWMPGRAGAESLTWDQAVQTASRANAALRAARSNLESAEFSTRSARAGFFPQLFGGIGYTDVSRDTDAITTTETGYSTSLSLNQNLFSGFQDQGLVEQARANLAASYARLDGIRAQVSRDLKAAFATVQLAQENVRLSQSIVRRREENLGLVELRFEGGRENRGAYLVTRAAVAEARYELLQAEQAVYTAGAELARVLGLPATSTLEAVGGVPVSAPEPAPDFARLAQQVPDYREAEAQQNVALADVKISRSNLLPSLDLQGTLAREGEDWAPQDDRRAVSLNLSIPIYSGGRNYYNVQSAAANLEAAASNKESTEAQALVALRQAHAAYVESAQKLEVDRESLEAATVRAEITRARYDNGLVSFEEWDRVENDLIQRQRSYIQSQRQRVVAEANWELAQGRGAMP
jgi:outer membrane protein TolC